MITPRPMKSMLRMDPPTKESIPNQSRQARVTLWDELFMDNNFRKLSVELATKLTVTKLPYRISTKDGKSRFFPRSTVEESGGAHPPAPKLDKFFPLPVDASAEVTFSRSRTPFSFSGSEDGGILEEGYGDDTDGIPFGAANLWVDELTRDESDEDQESL